MRILQLIKTLNIGGVEKSTIKYSNILSSAIEFIGICSFSGHYDYSNLISKNINIFHLPRPNNRKIADIIKNLFFIINILKKYNITVIHYHHRIFLPVIYFIILFFPSVKIVYSHHCFFNDFVNKFLIADKFIAISDSTKNDVLKYKRVQVEIIKHGIVMLPFRLPAKERDTFNIGYIGRFTKEKRIIELIKAFQLIYRRDQRFRLILRGEGTLYNEINLSIAESGLQDFILVDSSKDQEADIYSGIDLLVMLSDNIEGFGLTIIEAMMFSVPVIATDIPVFKEIIINQFNGLLVNNNPEDIVNAVISLFQNDQLYLKIAKNGYQTAINDFRIETTIEKLIGLYASL
ncbi:MAG: glycosyltransferase family 4 protein [Ignavibacteria bacterium]